MTMTRSKHNYYLKAVDYYLSGETVKLIRATNSKKLSIAEKKLLKARILARENKWDESIELLSSISTTSNFLLGEKFALIGISYIQKSEFEKSIINNIESLKYYEKIEDSIGLFTTNYNLSVSYLKLGLNLLSDKFISYSEKYASTTRQNGLIIRAKAFSLSLKKDHKESIKLIDRAINEKHNFSINDILTLKLTASEIYIRSEEYEEAYKVLSKLIRSKQIKESAKAICDFYFLKLYLGKIKKLSSRKPLQVSKSNEHSLQWNLIKTLIEGDQLLSRNLWNKLRLIAPSKYLEDFKFLDSELDSIFSRLILKIRKKTVHLELSRYIDDVKGKRSKALLQSLINSNGPISKEDLIELTWETKYNPSFDSRFYKLIERIKSCTGLNIVNDYRSYYIKQN